MQVHFNGSDIDIIPFELTADLSVMNWTSFQGGSDSSCPGSINLNREYFYGFTDFATVGTYVNLKGVFENWYVQHYSESVDIAPSTVFEYSFEDENTGDTVTAHYTCRVVHGANENYITVGFNMLGPDDPNYDPSRFDYFKIDYASNQYNYDYLWGLAVVNSINAELALNNYNNPYLNPEYNGIHDVLVIRGSYQQQIAEAIGDGPDDWSPISIINRSYYYPEGCPMYATNKFDTKVPWAIPGWTGQSLSGLGHYVYVWDTFGLDYSFDPYNGYHDFKIYNTSPEDMPEAHKDPNDDVNKPSGPPGKYKDTSSRISGPGLPLTSALATGFIKAYNPSAGEASALKNYMLTDSFITGVKKLMANPIDYVIGFHMIPVKPVGTSNNIILGGIDTGISSTQITQDYVQFDCGSVQVPEYWGAFIDYSSTKVEIYVPFVGIMPLDVDDVVNATLTLSYNINVLSGACTAYLDCDTGRTLHSVVYYWNGNMQSSLPITNNDYSQKLSMAVQGVGQLAGGMAAGNGALGAMGAASIIGSVLKKPLIQKAGSLGSDAGMLSQFTPFLIITRPVQALPANYKALNGYAAQIGGTVGSFSGYLECESVELAVSCTDAERDEILTLLRGGVFV